MLSLKNNNLLRTDSLINGKWLKAKSNRTFDVVNPANQEIIASVASVGAIETQIAIEGAEQAQKLWRKKTAKERSQLLRKWHDLLLENQDDLALIMTLEQGKPLAEARGEIAYGANFLEWFGEEAKRVYGDTIPGPAPDKRIVVVKEPVGVVGCITPWNFPNAMLTRKIGGGAVKLPHSSEEKDTLVRQLSDIRVSLLAINSTLNKLLKTMEKKEN